MPQNGNVVKTWNEFYFILFFFKKKKENRRRTTTGLVVGLADSCFSQEEAARGTQVSSWRQAYSAWVESTCWVLGPPSGPKSQSSQSAG